MKHRLNESADMLRISVINTSGDDRPFDDYEKTFTYAWVRSLDGLIEKVPASYIVNGTYDEDGNIPILIWGVPSDLNCNHPRGFEITNIICDERLLASGELDKVWIPSFVNLVLSCTEGILKNDKGQNLYDEHGCLSYERMYDYVWCSTDVDLLRFDGAMTLVEGNSGMKYHIWKR